MSSSIRMADLAARHAEVADDVEARVRDVLRSGRWIGGPVVAECERTAARLFGRAAAVGVNSGTDALMLALQAVGVRAGDEVIVPALSFFATAGAVHGVGATPVVVDVREDGCIDPEAARNGWTRRTRALVTVHLFGTLAEAPDLDVPVVDDSAQAVGGDPPRARGVLTAISTYPTKTWGASGDGGFVIGDDAELLGRVRRLANHGMDGVPHHHERVEGLVGRNTRLDTVQAAALLGHAARLDRWVARRRAIGRRYDEALPPSLRPLPRDAGSPVHHYVVLHPERDRIREALAARGIETAIYYPRPLHAQPAIEARHACPVADDLVRALLALPVHETLTDEDVERVIAALHEAV